MPTDIQLTGGYSPLEISGKEYNARTLTEKDHAELNEYVQIHLIKLAKKALTDDMSSEDRNEILQAAIQGAAGVRWGSLTGQRIMTSLEGFLRLGWQMIRHGHPKLTYEQFYILATPSNGNGEMDKEVVQGNIDNIDEAFLRLNTSFEREGEEEIEEDSSEKSKSN